MRKQFTDASELATMPDHLPDVNMSENTTCFFLERPSLDIF